MRYKDLILLLVLCVCCTLGLDAKDLFACEFNPSIHDLNNKLIGSRVDSKAIYRKVLKAANYERMHPHFKEMVERNKDNFRQGLSSYILYHDKEAGYSIYLKRYLMLGRVRFFGDDAAWTYEKEPAINPETGRPWIDITEKEFKFIMRVTKQKFSDEDQQVLKDVLSIVNENFHYFYGMKFVDLGRDPTVDKADLMGKFVPDRLIMFDKDVEMFNLEQYTKQQAMIYRHLGHPIYSYEDLIDSRLYVDGGSDCSIGAIKTTALKSGYIWNIPYFYGVCPEEVIPSMGARSAQVRGAGIFLKHMVLKMGEFFKDQYGVNVRSRMMNETPLAQALSLVYQKTKKYVDAVAKHEYVTTSQFKNGFEEGVNRLSDVVPLPGVKTKRKKIKVSTPTRQNLHPHHKSRNRD